MTLPASEQVTPQVTDAGLVAGLVVGLALVLVVVLLAAWLSWTATRLDRLHHRVDLARHTLTQHLLARSAVTLELATSGALDPAASLVLADAAHHARATAGDRAAAEQAESDLSEALRAVLGERDEVAALREDPASGSLVVELADAARKVELARRFHNDQVVAARALRSRRRVRWLRLSGHAPEPTSVDLDDVPPPDLVAVLPGGAQAVRGRTLEGSSDAGAGGAPDPHEQRRSTQ